MIRLQRPAIFTSCLFATAAMGVAGCGGGGSSGGDCEANLVAGDLVITEIMANPSGADDGNEYFEIFNAGTAAIDLTGLALISSRDDGTDEDTHTMREATIAPGQYFVVGGILDEFKPAHVDYGAGNDLQFRNSNGRLALNCKGILVDEASYTDAPDGASLELNGAEAPNHVRNDEEANFCEATNEFAPDFLGTPQMPNGVCGNVVPGMCDDNGTMRPTVPPGIGDIVITEFMPNPEGTDGDGEWIEIRALADVDLNGLTVQRSNDGPGTPGTITDTACVSVTAGDHVLFASNEDMATNGGLPMVDATFGFSLVQSDGAIEAVLGQEILDQVTWESSTSGVSINLDPGSNDPVANDNVANFCGGTAAYGDNGNLGTPREDNTGCVLAGQCLDGGSPRAIVPATDVTITEWLTDPAGAGTDSDQEWFEVRFNVAGDLNGLELGREAGNIRDTVNETQCVPVAAGGFAVIAHGKDPLVNGGLPQVDGLFNFALLQDNDRIFVGFGGVELDAIDYGTTQDGTAQQRDPAVDATICDAVDAYGNAGNLGTPGAINPACP